MMYVCFLCVQTLSLVISLRGSCETNMCAKYILIVHENVAVLICSLGEDLNAIHHSVRVTVNLICQNSTTMVLLQIFKSFGSYR